LDFASQMATFSAFWALSFTVWMHVLHIKKQCFGLGLWIFTPIERPYTSSYWWLMVTCTPNGTVSEIRPR